jgi:hypothetical protein
VFQAYLTTFLIEPGYEEPIRKVQEMLQSEKKFGFYRLYEKIFPSATDPVYSIIVKEALQCPDDPTCFIWAAVYHNISVAIKDLDVETYRAMGNWTDESNRPLLCEMEDGVVKTFSFAILVKKGNPFFEFIDDVLGRILEGGIFMHIKKRRFHKLKVESKVDVPTIDDTYYAITISHLQAAFYFLMLGYILAVAFLLTEIMCYRYSKMWRGPTVTLLCHRQTKIHTPEMPV